MNTQSHIRDAVNIVADVTFGKEHVGKDFITYMVKFPDMTEKEGIQQGAFWDLSENAGADQPEVTLDESENTTNKFQPHEPRERTIGVDFFDVISQFFLVAFALLFVFSNVEDTWHISPWECSEQVIEGDDGTFQCQQYGITEPRAYDSSGFEIVELSEKVIAVGMYMLIIFFFIAYCWFKLSKKDHLRHLGEENVVVLMTSRFGMTPKIKETIRLQDDSFIQRTSGHFKIHSKGQKPFNLSKFDVQDCIYVTGLEIRRE